MYWNKKSVIKSHFVSILRRVGETWAEDNERSWVADRALDLTRSVLESTCHRLPLITIFPPINVMTRGNEWTSDKIGIYEWHWTLWMPNSLGKTFKAGNMMMRGKRWQGDWSASLRQTRRLFTDDALFSSFRRNQQIKGWNDWVGLVAFHSKHNSSILKR